MRAHAQLALLLLLALLVVGARSYSQRNRMRISKCCGRREMLSGDGQSCVRADWAEDASVSWRWLPPGIPMRSGDSWTQHWPSFLSPVLITVSVNTSSLWDAHWDPQKPLNDDLWRRQLVFFETDSIVRPKPGGGFRHSHRYCTDAALPPLGPFALKFATDCTRDECIRKCCLPGYVLVYKGENWTCEADYRGYWSPSNSSFTPDVDPEFPQEVLLSISHSPLHLAAFGDHLPDWGLSTEYDFFFSTRNPCFDFFRNEHDVQQGLFYTEKTRIARGVYWLLRPLCFASALLLAVPLLYIACDKRRRRSVHTWFLASHVACLFGFNAGQIVYYMTISDTIDRTIAILPDLQRMCKDFALSMYFLLIAAWFWLTALCGNTALDFKLQVAPQGASARKRLVAFSAFAWGLPALLTLACFLLFTPLEGYFEEDTDLPLYNPPLMKARVCYAEQIVKTETGRLFTAYSKYGTALIYYGPLGCLVICNIICLVYVTRGVNVFKRSNTNLCREGDPDALEMNEGNNLTEEHIGSSDSRTAGSRNGGSSRTQAGVKTTTLYITVLVVIGAVELISEIVNSLIIPDDFLESHFSTFYDFDYPYRASGFAIDFVRAACVAWLAAPEGGYTGPLLGWLRKQMKFTRQGP